MSCLFVTLELPVRRSSAPSSSSLSGVFVQFLERPTPIFLKCLCLKGVRKINTPPNTNPKTHPNSNPKTHPRRLKVLASRWWQAIFGRAKSWRLGVVLGLLLGWVLGLVLGGVFETRILSVYRGFRRFGVSLDTNTAVTHHNYGSCDA